MFKTKTILHSIAVASGLSAAILASSGTVVAQEAPPSPTFGNRPDAHLPERAPLAGAPAWLQGIELTREQRERIFDLLAPVRADREQQLRDRFIGEENSEDDVRELIATGRLTKREAVRVATGRADRMRKQLINHAEILGAIYEDVLTSEQRQTLQSNVKRAPQVSSGRMQFRRQDGGAVFRDSPFFAREPSPGSRGERDRRNERR